MTNQPKWKFIANLGDATPLIYGGYFIYQDLTGIYDAEAELLEIIDDESKTIVYRFILDRYKNYNGHLIPFEYNIDWPYPAEKYIEWFDDKLNDIADQMGITITRLIDLFCSDNILERAEAFRELGYYCGFENLDNYPNKYTQAELNRKYVWYHNHPNRTK